MKKELSLLFEDNSFFQLQNIRPSRRRRRQVSKEGKMDFSEEIL